ncbi:hypothetical protein [Arcanobacterium hippocoleae]|uniref:hypothetical protein n=1 Tax=Arcanobacterium hippocoleae TaxID=149017 RepID=UPI00333EB6E0
MNESVLHELNAAQFAGICAGFLGDKRISKLPIADPKLRAAWKRIDANYWFLRDLEAKHGIDLTAEPNSSGVQLFTLWADGATLPAILKFGRIEVGDFIGSTRRLLDLLSQLARAGADSWIGKRADTAIHLIRRWDWL